MLGLTTSLSAPVIVVFWLEWGTPRYGFFLWLPLLLPALPLVIGQYGVLLRWGWYVHCRGMESFTLDAPVYVAGSGSGLPSG